MNKKKFINELITVEEHLALLLSDTPLNDIEWMHLNELRKQLHLEIIAIKCNAYEVVKK